MEHQGTPGNIMEHHGTPGNIKEHHGTSWNIMEHQGTSSWSWAGCQWFMLVSWTFHSFDWRATMHVTGARFRARVQPSAWRPTSWLLLLVLAVWTQRWVALRHQEREGERPHSWTKFWSQFNQRLRLFEPQWSVDNWTKSNPGGNPRQSLFVPNNSLSLYFQLRGCTSVNVRKDEMRGGRKCEGIASQLVRNLPDEKWEFETGEESPASLVEKWEMRN